MAKKKIVDEELNLGAQENPTEEAPVGLDGIGTASDEITSAQEEESSAPKNSEGVATAQSDNIPVDVLAILKAFPNEEQLYVTKFGGVFTGKSELSVKDKAILYKNPYYKS